MVPAAIRGRAADRHPWVATFCLLHGAWHDGSCWARLIAELGARGHEAVAPELPLHDPEAGFQRRIQPALRALEGVDGQLVIVGHSASSGYAVLVVAQRPGSLLIHLCPRLGQFPPQPGAPPTFRAGFPFPVSNGEGATVWDPNAAIAAMYARIAPGTARALAARLRPTTPPSDEFPLAGHPDVPTALVYATDDEIFEPAWERFMARQLLGIEPVEIPGGHFPMLEDPAALAELLDRLAAAPDGSADR
jgi:pimeloyl-ACP methyl ester carboxylesterase